MARVLILISSRFKEVRRNRTSSIFYPEVSSVRASNPKAGAYHSSANINVDGRVG
jgi:hypothetical protein